jgi:hypothetical protein
MYNPYLYPPLVYGQPLSMPVQAVAGTEEPRRTRRRKAKAKGRRTRTVHKLSSGDKLIIAAAIVRKAGYSISKKKK